MRRKQIDLESFLADLPDETAAKTKAAAARIDELEHAAIRIGEADKTFMRLFLLSGVLFIVAVGFLVSGNEMFVKGQPHLLDVVVLLMAGALPAMVLVYCLKMNERTKLDRQKFEIIENYFMPHNAIYFPPGPDRKTGIVAIAESGRGWNRKPDDDKRYKKAGWYW